MSLRVLVTYLPDDRLTDVPTIEINADTGSIYVDRNLSPRLSLKLKELSTHLTAFYLDMEEEKEC